MNNNRKGIICLLHILKKYSDENHILTMSNIIEKMNIIYGLNPDRRTIYGYINLLSDLDYDISTYEENKIGYFLRNRNFEIGEISLLVNAVYSFPFISKKQTNDLIKKLQNDLSNYQKKSFNHLITINDDKKSNNQQMFLNMELLAEAISDKKQVSFTYLKYGIDKKLHSRRDREYIVNPYRITYANEKYYLVCNYTKYSNISFYRIDLIKDIKILDVEWNKTIDTTEIENVVYAFYGKPELITIKCNKDIIADVIDKIGTKINIEELSGDELEVSFISSPAGIKFWALQYLSFIEIVEPKWLRDEIIEIIKNNRYDRKKPL